MTKKPFYAIGMMSGTSMDGIDLAYIKTNGVDEAELIADFYQPYSQEQKDQIAVNLGKVASDEDTDKLNENLAKWHADAFHEFVSQKNIDKSLIEVVGFHGQTLAHDPDNRFTWQIGDGQLLADLINCPVVYDFRTADVSAGGQGAPLVPIYHHCLTCNLPRPIAILNIGGVANITYAGGKEGDLIAFDTGPGNALINDWVGQKGLEFDFEGNFARQGTAEMHFVTEFLASPYFKRAYPKSLDRDQFTHYRERLVNLSFEDGAATLTAFTTQSILQAIQSLPEKPAILYVTGGGRHNIFMMQELERLTGVDIRPVEELGWNGDSLEAEAFAFLAVRNLLDLDICFPLTTGAVRPTKGGQLKLPKHKVPQAQGALG